MDHLSFEDYLAALRGESEFSAVDQTAHRHLMDICSVCRSEWQGRRSTEESGAGVFPNAPQAEFSVPLLVPEDDREISLDANTMVERLLVESREAARSARDDLRRLQRLPVDRWRRRVDRARTRFRSRAFAELLVEESRCRVRTAPVQAAALAELVPTALAHLPESGELPWAEVLVARAAAHRGNALRIVGDLPAAESIFVTLRQTAQNRPLRDDLAKAEIDSLEATLRLALRQFPLAEALLASAADFYHLADNAEGLGRTLIKRSNLLRALDQPREALSVLSRAAILLEESKDPYLYFCTVQGQINTLLDLDRTSEAQELLRAESGIYLHSGDAYTAALHSVAQARIDLQFGRLADSVTGFEATRDQFLALDRDYDAVLASLYLADALLAAGRMADLRRLAADLVPLFHARGVERETLASLRLFAQAVEAETVTAALLAQLRRSLHPAAAAAPSLVPDG